MKTLPNKFEIENFINYGIKNLPLQRFFQFIYIGLHYDLIRFEEGENSIKDVIDDIDIDEIEELFKDDDISSGEHTLQDKDVMNILMYYIFNNSILNNINYNSHSNSESLNDILQKQLKKEQQKRKEAEQNIKNLEDQLKECQQKLENPPGIFDGIINLIKK